MRKIQNTDQDLSHEGTANPFLHESILKRYAEAKVVDMRNNHTLKKNKTGYISIKPIDPNKTY